MKRVLGGLVGLILFCGAASAQPQTLATEPSYSEVEVKGAFTTCLAEAERVAEANRQSLEFFWVDTQTFSEKLENCVVWVLKGRPIEAVPLG